jgi:hypothetical protein
MLYSDRPKFKVNSRLAGTPEENKAAVLRTIATFGTWSVDESNNNLIMHIEGSIFPNQEGMDISRWVYVYQADGNSPGDQLADKLEVANPLTGTLGVTVNLWKRVN